MLSAIVHTPHLASSVHSNACMCLSLSKERERGRHKHNYKSRAKQFGTDSAGTADAPRRHKGALVHTSSAHTPSTSRQHNIHSPRGRLTSIAPLSARQGSSAQKLLNAGDATRPSNHGIARAPRSRLAPHQTRDRPPVVAPDLTAAGCASACAAVTVSLLELDAVETPHGEAAATEAAPTPTQPAGQAAAAAVAAAPPSAPRATPSPPSTRRRTR